MTVATTDRAEPRAHESLRGSQGGSFARVINASGIDGHWTPNLLRHTAASLMAHAGLAFEHVADQLGHTDLRMLHQHYRHRIKPTINGANAINQLLGTSTNHPTESRDPRDTEPGDSQG